MAAKSISDDDIVAAVRSAHGSLAAAARTLQISPRTLSRRLAAMKPIDLETDDFDRVMSRYQQAVMAAAMAGNLKAMITVLTHTGFVPQPRLRLKDDQ